MTHSFTLPSNNLVARVSTSIPSGETGDARNEIRRNLGESENQMDSVDSSSQYTEPRQGDIVSSFREPWSSENHPSSSRISTESEHLEQYQ